ncbi:hypothetical protein MSIMFB_04454 [Mycobacterium simulans]|uniref:Glycosyltransferase 2-like domain-containing protein n=1 Tax=Mycobacterium simulans TaxID=627089 RepID=A0A7Z7NCC8_9MYCO|nr:hypothetical protein MSIMFB_04454 [Mycobacterium simulans]
MQIFSVVTPVFDGGDTYLMETYESIACQRLPEGWAVQWLVQEDGKTGKPLDRLPNKPWVSKGVGRTGGAACARTLALYRAEGVLMRALDADDLFPDEYTLARDVEALAANPDLGWTVAPALDLYPEGRIVPGPCDPPPGRLPSGFLAEGLRAGGIVKTCGLAGSSDLRSGGLVSGRHRVGRDVGGPFEQFAFVEDRAGPDEGDEFGCVYLAPANLCGHPRNSQDLWIAVFQATSVPVCSSPSEGGCGGVISVGRSSSLPLWKTAPARTRATRCGALTARQRAWAASISL